MDKFHSNKMILYRLHPALYVLLLSIHVYYIIHNYGFCDNVTTLDLVLLKHSSTVCSTVVPITTFF